MSKKFILALVLSIAAVIAVVLEQFGYGEESGWGGLAREWVTRTYAALAVIGAWWLARIGVKEDTDRCGRMVLWFCQLVGAVGALWLAFMLYVAIGIILDS